jgi:ribonucleoside-diphosphate reductase alpha chain
MITVIKRSGERVPLNIEKIQRQVAFACRGIADVSPSMIELKSQLELHDGISSKTIDELLLKAMVNLIDETECPDVGHTNYQFVAGKQRLMMLRKEVYGQYEPKRLYDIVQANVVAGVYTPELLTWYTEDEWDKIDSFVDHEKDEAYAYAAIEQLVEKYLVKNRVTGQLYESPQVRYAVSAATAFHAEAVGQRLKYVREFYQSASDGLFTLATPVLAGLGTPTKQFSSCVLIRVNDTLDSIFAGGEMMAKYASKRAGIGLEIGRLRPLGAAIRGGEIKHTGMLPFLKKWFGDLRSCSQGGIRNASATVFYPIWHYQFDDLIVLKNNQGTDETRVRHMDYGVVISSFFLKRFKNQGVITFFDPNEVPDLYEAYYKDIKLFEELYVKYEKRKDLTKKVMSAEEVFKSGIFKERTDTGRIYIVNIDNVQRQGPFDPAVHTIYQSNLCCLTGDSKVTVFDGYQEAEVTIEELVEMYKSEVPRLLIKSFDASGICWQPIETAWLTKEVIELIDIEYEGLALTCTPDHKLLTTRGWVEAQELREDDILMLGNSPTYKYEDELRKTLQSID